MVRYNVFDKQHYLKQMEYICYCINAGISHYLKEIIVDNFAGGGGASTGIEMEVGRSVDIAINYDIQAIRMHMANHPDTEHYCESVWDIDPLKVCRGNPVGLAWFSPDCKHFSKAKGDKPKDKAIRGLAWVALRWAGLVRPRVIMLENVEEFQSWGPLNRRHRPIKSKKGYTFNKFIQQLENLGYVVEFKELVAADYGAPTMRKRFFMIARCDRLPIIWPERTHAPTGSKEVHAGICKPYVGAYTQIDFDMPCPSIFETSKEIKEKYGICAKRPLAENTMKRIARGMQKFVINNNDPFIIQVNHSGADWHRSKDIKEPLPTITSRHGFGFATPYITQIGQTGFTENRSKPMETPLTTIVSKNEHCLIAPTLIQYHSETNKGGVRGQELQDPIMTVDSSNRYGLVSAFIQKYFDGGYKGAGSGLADPLHKVTSIDKNSLCTAHIVKMKGNNIGQNPKTPLQTITAGGQHYGEIRAVMEPLNTSFIVQQQGKSIGKDLREPLNTMTGVNHMAEVRAFLIKYYGQGTGQDIKKPLDTVTANDRFGLVQIQGVDYAIVDIGLRMLEPKELYGCQGFPEDYIIDRDHEGKSYSKAEQVMKCGNAVPPPFAAALVKSNLPELCKGKRIPICRMDRLQQEITGQMRFA